MKFYGASSVIAELLPFDNLNFNNFFRPQPKIGNLWLEFYEIPYAREVLSGCRWL